METLIPDLIKDSNFLVTGGAGFIGSNLCEFLVKKNAKKVVCIDNLVNGKLENIEELIKYPNFIFVNCDIRDFYKVMELTKDIDYVLHQAAWGSVPRSMKYPLDYNSNNVIGTCNIFESARINKVKKIVYASSSSVYGDHSILPKIEGIEGNLLSPYALSKKINEQYGKLYSEVFNLPTIGLRYFNVFGRRQNPDGDYAAVIPKFIKLIHEGITPTVFGDGNQSRDFTYIDNVIEANIKALFLSTHESYGKAFNIAYGQNIKINDLFNQLKSLLGVQISLKYENPRKGDILNSRASIAAAKKSFSYNPVYSFADGLKLLIEWYKRNQKI